MEFLNFFAQRMNVSRSEAGELLEHVLSNYRPARDYSMRVLPVHAADREPHALSADEQRAS